MLIKKIQRLIAALVLVGFVGSTGLLVTAEASPHHHREPHLSTMTIGETMKKVIAIQAI